jgi:hypothetical protein
MGGREKVMGQGPWVEEKDCGGLSCRGGSREGKPFNESTLLARDKVL